MDRVTRHTVVHHSSTSIYIPNFIEIGKTFCERTIGQTDVPTDGRTFPPLMLLDVLYDFAADRPESATDQYAKEVDCSICYKVVNR